MRNVVIVVVIILVILGGVLAATRLGRNALSPQLKELEAIQVRDYEGKHLSSINDFRENSIEGPQHFNMDTYRLKITGLVDSPREYAYDDVINNRQLYKKVVTLNCVEGWDATILWEGVLLKDLFDEAKVKPGAKVVVFHCYDGYSTSESLDYILNNNIIMAYKINEVVIPPERGFPFHLVAESKWGYKWAKWITEIELSDNTDFRGFWESRGYSNIGDLNKSFYQSGGRPPFEFN